MSKPAPNIPPPQPSPSWLRALVTVAFVGLAVYFGVSGNMVGTITLSILALCTLARLDRLAAVRVKDWFEIAFQLPPDPIQGEVTREPPLEGADDTTDEASG